MDHLTATRLPAETLLSMHHEIVAGEGLNSENAEAQYRQQVKDHSKGKLLQIGFEEAATTSHSKRKRKTGGVPHKPGVRLPGRDPVKSAAERQNVRKESKHG